MSGNTNLDCLPSSGTLMRCHRVGLVRYPNESAHRINTEGREKRVTHGISEQNDTTIRIDVGRQRLYEMDCPKCRLICKLKPFRVSKAYSYTECSESMQERPIELERTVETALQKGYSRTLRSATTSSSQPLNFFNISSWVAGRTHGSPGGSLVPSSFGSDVNATRLTIGVADCDPGRPPPAEIGKAKTC